MPKTIKGWITLAISFGVLLFVFNNVAFLSNLTARR